MFNKIVALVNKNENKKLLSNFISLSTLQIVNYLLPLVTIPYLAKVLGVELFGLLAFATAFVLYFEIIIDYGFNLTATKEVSINRENKEKLIEIFSSVMLIKAILFFLSLLIFSFIIFSFDKFSKDWAVYFYTFSMLFGQMLFPIWFFQGIEKMKYITYLNILSKSIFTIAIFVFVQEPSDYYKVPILTSIGYFVAGIGSLYLVYYKFNIVFKFQAINIYKKRLSEGVHVFMAGIFTSAYTLSTIFILGLFTNNEIVGYYALAEKIVKAMSSIFHPINGAIFPHISRMVKHSRNKAKIFIQKVVIYSSIIMFLLSMMLFIFAEELIYLISSDDFYQSIILLKVMAFLPFIITIARIFSVNYLINFNLQSSLLKIYLYTAILSLILAFSLVPIYYQLGSAITIVMVELFATSYMFIVIKNKIGFI